MPAAIDRAGSLVAQLRRRLQLDQRLDQMAASKQELERQSRRLLVRRLPSSGLLAGLGTVFVLGVVLVMAGVFMPASITGSLGWALALVGLGGQRAPPGLARSCWNVPTPGNWTPARNRSPCCSCR